MESQVMSGPQVRAVLRHPAWTHVALLSTALASLVFLYLDGLVAAKVHCGFYRGAVNQTIEGVGVVAFFGAGAMLVLNLLRGLLLRSWRIALLSVLVAAAGSALVVPSFLYTVTYCMFDGIEILFAPSGC